MWLWLKTWVAEVMVSIGVDWPSMDDGDKLSSAIGIAIGAIGIALGFLSLIVTRRQGVIAETQHRIETELRNRKANLKLEMSMVGIPLGDPGMHRHPVYLYNRGNKSANDVIFRLYVQNEFMRDDRVQAEFPDAIRYPERVGAEGLTNAGPFVRFDGLYRNPVHPRRNPEIGYFLINERYLETVRIYWQIDAEDGQFPEGTPGPLRFQGED